MAPIAPDALERWTYRKSGMDYGPFSTHDIQELIKQHQIDGQTELYNVRTRERKPLDQWPAMARFRAEFLRQEAEERKRREVLHEVSRFERTVERQRKLPIVLVVMIMIGGAVAYFIFEEASPSVSAYPLDFFKELSIERLPLLTESELATLRPQPQKTMEAPIKSKARKNGRSQSAPALELDVSSPVEVDLTGEEDDGRQLTMDDLDRVQKSVSPGLVSCFREEAARRPEFEGGSVVLYVMGNGDVKLSRLATRPPASAELGSCARRAVSGVKVPPFSGSAQVMNIPIYVSSMH